MDKCKDCEYFLPKYLECECSDAPQSKADFCMPDEEACEFFELKIMPKEHIERNSFRNSIETGVLDDETCPAHIAAEVMQYIDEEPAADVREVEYGENISKMHYSDEFKCSKCDFTCEGIEEKLFDDEGYDIGVTRAFDCNFCPKCGAIMQKKE